MCIRDSDKDYLVLESNFLYRDAKQGDIVVLYTPPFSENDELLVKLSLIHI